MVSTRILKELRYLIESNERAIDLHKYSDRLFDVVFDIITADTFVAGTASKILDRETLLPEERAIISKPLVISNGIWRCADGEMFDLRGYPEIYSVARGVEKLRAKCHQALD